MRVAIFTDLYLPYIGGTEVRFSELSANLRARGHDVLVFCMGHDADLPAEEDIDGVVVRRHPLVNDYRRSFIPGMPRGMLPIIRYAAWCRKVLRREAFELVVFSEFPFGHIFVAPKSVRQHALIDWCEVRTSIPFRALQRVVPRLVACNTAVSRSVSRQIALQSGRSVEYFPTGIAVGRYERRPFGQRSGLVYLGRLRPHKRIPLLVRAFGLLRREGFAQSLTIAGSGEAQPDVRAEVALLEVDARAAVDIRGYVADAEKVRLLGGSTVLILPSRREGFPVIVAEAMASGLPVVTTNDGENGTVEVVREYGNGVICDPTPEALAAGISEALANWNALSTRALSAASTLDWHNLVGRFEELARGVSSARQ